MINYREFSQQVVRVSDELRKANRLLFEGKAANLKVKHDIFKYSTILNSLTQTGEKIYNKGEKEMYFDGCRFWYQDNKHKYLKKAQ